jgi:hypothetical protein
MHFPACVIKYIESYSMNKNFKKFPICSYCYENHESMMLRLFIKLDERRQNCLCKNLE